jgi:multicomponent Na+:H+ antiporter subunit E
MYYLIVAIMLAVFWILLSGHFTALLLGFGIVSVVLVVWLVFRMDRADKERSTLYPTPRLIAYWGWLLWEVVKANVDLVKRIWHPDLPIEPSWSRLDIKVSTPLEKTFYANSITLTPGTLTTNVNDDHFMVHALSKEGIDGLREGEMERRILRLKV